MTIIEYLNNTTSAGTFLVYAVSALILWLFIWKLFLGKWLFRHDVGTFWYAMYEAGPFGTFGLALMALLLLVLLVTSLQAVSSYGTKVAAAAAFFWAVLIAVAVLIVRTIKK